MEAAFPITVRFEDGELESYDSVEDLETGLEDFDSDVDVGCAAWDALGRPVRLKLKLLSLEELSIRS